LNRYKAGFVEVALKIDVDTHQGLSEGVPRLMRALDSERITASFYTAMGPDNSGRAIVRAFRNRGFLSKMMRTKAVSMYGLRTVLSGTVLPSRPIALAFPETLREIERAGFELGVHGYDHVRWQDRIDSLNEDEIRAELEDAFEAFRAVTGRPARAFAAPGWRTNTAASILLDEAKLAYRSDTRGYAPYRCAVDGRVLATLEIPTTLPTLDEVMGRPGLSEPRAIFDFYLKLFKPDALNVHTIHAETEGMGQLDFFVELIRALKGRGVKFVQVAEIGSRLKASELPVCEIARAEIEGRAGWIAAQGREISLWAAQ